MRRRPLLRAAAISGGAYYAGKRRAAAKLREAGERARADAQAAAGPGGRAGLPAGSRRMAAIEQLRDLGRLHEQGLLTDAEFAAQRSKILGA